MEQHKANTQAADQENNIAVVHQNCNTKEPAEKSSFDCNTDPIQRELASTGVEQNLSDRLSACDTDSVGKDYRCNTGKTGFAHREMGLAEGTGTSHCQERSPKPRVVENIAASDEVYKGPLASEESYLEFMPGSCQAELCGTQHTAQQGTHITPSQSTPAGSTVDKATDKDYKLPDAVVQNIVQQPFTATNIPCTEISSDSYKAEDAMDEITKDGITSTEEGSTKSVAKESLQSRLHVATGNGNSTDEHDGSLSNNLQPSGPNDAFSQNTHMSSNQPEDPQATHENQLSPVCINCTGSPKPVFAGNKISASEGLEIKGISSDEQFNSMDVTEVCYDISNEGPKVLGHRVCTSEVTDESCVVVCGASDVMIEQNDCAKSMQLASPQDQEPLESCILLHKNLCTNSGGPDSNQPCLSHVNSDCLVQQEQESIPTEHKLSQIVCLNDCFSTPDDVNVDEKQHEGAEVISGLNAVEMKDFIDVGILVQPGMEDTWLVVSESSTLIDGQCESTEDAEMMEVSTDTVVHCPDSQASVAVYECTVPCFQTEAIHEDVKLLLTDKEVEDMANKQSLKETDLALQNVSTCLNTLTPSENICLQNMVPKPDFCSNVENTVTVIDPILMNNASPEKEGKVSIADNKSGVSQITVSGVIDPKLLILKRSDAPLLKHPPMLARISRTLSPAPLFGTTADTLVSVECLSNNESTMGISDEKEVSSLSSSPVLNAPHNLTGVSSISKNELLNESEYAVQCESQVTCDDPLSDFTSSTLTQTCNSPSLSALSSTLCDAITEQNPSKQCPVSQTCTDSMLLGGELELDEQQHSTGQYLRETKERQLDTMGHLEASIEESSDGEADSSMEAQPNDSIAIPSPDQNKHGQSRTDKQAFLLKVRQWIAGRGTTGSTPCTSRTPSPPPASSSGDWTHPYADRASPLCSSHGKHTLPSQSSSGTSQSEQSLTQRSRLEKHADMAELAKHEAEIEHRTLSLKREGFWSLKRLSRIAEPVRPKVQWDYLCEEMQWLSADFAQERRWKRGVARKVVRMVMRHHEEIRQKEERAKREEQAKLRRIAASIAKEVRGFWSSVEKVVQYKQQSRLEEKRKKALDLQLDFIVGQTERYSDLLSQSLQATPAAASVPSRSSQLKVADEDDIDFEPPCEEEDDEETIEVEEQQEGNDIETQKKEIELLRQESTLPLDQLLSTLALPQGSMSEEEVSEESSSMVDDEDKEFSANEEDSEDVEDTIAAQEVVEGDADHAEELDDLAREGELSVEELLEKYRGAYTSDAEEPVASPESSEEFEETEEEEETEGEDSDDGSSASQDSTDNSEEEEEEEEEEAVETDESEEEDKGEGMEVLLREGEHSPSIPTSPRPKKEISHIAATAESLQPKGYTLATTSVKTPIPFLLHGSLREYQHIGLDWLVTMYEKKLNGILADEMGLGKTIQTIALLAHLACEKGNWGPHLIIVPTSVMLNWEMELKRWCPGFKILTYYGSQKERKLKRQGWTKPNAFHVCITSYKLVLQDHQAFRRKSWKYLILDEAQNIKNFKSQRWQSLLNFNSHRRLLLTGTPLQNSLMELWSLMHFLMPHVFQSHREFKEWFSNPLTGMIEGSQEYNEGLVKRLHKVLRPFLLRRIKVDVEKQMPKKYEHVIRCRLSKRQRFLYDDFMAQASTKETLASGHFMSVINILMQLRKVCNHPNLFDPRPIQSPFILEPVFYSTSSLVLQALEASPLQRCDLSMFNLISLEGHMSRYQADVYLPQRKVTRQLIEEIMEAPEPLPRPKPVRMKVNRMLQPIPKSDGRSAATTHNPRPTCPVSPAVQPLKPCVNIEVTTPAQASVQSVPPVCPVTPLGAPRAPICQNAPSTGSVNPITNIRPTPPSTVPAPLQPPSNVVTQRVLLSPDMQARLPSGEVVSIAQLASMAGRPVSSSQGSKPVTFQLQGNKLTLSGTPPVPQPRAMQGSVMHLVSSGGQHHLISQPAQVAVLHTLSQSGSISTNLNPASTSPTCSGLAVPPTPTQVPTSRVSGPGIVKIVVRQAPGKEGGQVPTMAVSPSLRVASPQSVLLHPHGTPSPALRLPAPQQLHQQPLACSPTPQASASSLSKLSPAALKVVEGTAPITGQAKTNTSLQPEESSTDANQHTGNLKPTPSSQSSALRSQRPRVHPPPRSPFYIPSLDDHIMAERDAKISQIFRINELHCNTKPIYGQEVLDFLTFLPGPSPTPARPLLNSWSNSGHGSCLIAQSEDMNNYLDKSKTLRDAIPTYTERLQLLSEVMERFTFVIPPVDSKPITMHCCHPPPSVSHQQALFSSMLSTSISPLLHLLHHIQSNMRTHFPDLRLIQYDCGKLQTLHLLLRKLKAEGHRVLIFTQMTRMLDVLEQFLNYHGHIYLRLDGSTRVEQRQALMERFNADRRIFCFILSTRSGGVGVNLTGADTVVFYDSDWNPTMDAQAQDRCHRIGQTRDVHIYRLISERTVEENILKKANQKRMLGDMAIEGGNFTTAFFKQQTIRELFDVCEGEKKETESSTPLPDDDDAINKQQTSILEQALCRAEDEEDIVAASQAKAEQVAELAEFNENIPLDDGDSRDQEEEELSKAEQEIAALVEQLTPIERYAMNFLEVSLEDICKEELKQAEEQVEAARKGLDQAKEEGLKLHQSSDNDEDDCMPHTPEEHQPVRRMRKHKEKGAPSTRVSGRLRGTPAKICDDAAMGSLPDQDRGRKKEELNSETSASCAPGSSSSLKLLQPKEVPEKLHSERGRGPNKEHMSSVQEQNQKPQTNQPSETEPHFSPTEDVASKSRVTLSQHRQSLSPVSVPSVVATQPVDRNATDHTLTQTPTFSEARDDHVQSDTFHQGMRERRASVSSDSICSPEHQPEPNNQHSSILSVVSPQNRSPRKRQSADGEVLKGLPEDSPSAKVLRKLPGRLVTVVEDKEPKRRRRGESTSGGGHTEGSSEETEHSDPTQETIPHSPDWPAQSLKDAPLPKSPPISPSQMQHGYEQVSPSRSSPGRCNHPYSPTHHSPDMPVLRNLPVRRRLETESRMAAQLGEQFVCRGRGQERRTRLSPKKPEPVSPKDTGATADLNAASPQTGKRKRGRPPRMPTRMPEPSEQNTPVPQNLPSDTQSPPLSPKRKRGRPRKGSTMDIVDSSRPVEEASSSTTSSQFMSQERFLSVNSNSHSSSDKPINVPSDHECPVLSCPIGSTSAPFKAADSPESPNTDSQTTRFTTSIHTPPTPSESQKKLTSTPELPTEKTDLQATVPLSESETSSPKTVQHASDSAHVKQTNASASCLLQPATSMSEGSVSSVPKCDQQLTFSSVSQRTAVNAIPFELLPESGKDTALVTQPIFESYMTTESPPVISVSPTVTRSSPLTIQACIKPTHEAIVTVDSQSLPVADLSQHSVEPDATLQTTFNPSLSKTAASQFQSKPEQTRATPPYSSQICLDAITSSESLESPTDLEQQLPASSQRTVRNTQCTTEQSASENQREPSAHLEDGLIKSSVEMENLENSNQVQKNNSQSQAKRRKLENMPENHTAEASSVCETAVQTTSECNTADNSLEEENLTEEQERRTTGKRRSISRQSSQETVRSSSPSSASSCNTHSSRSKKAGENNTEAKRKRMERRLQKETADGGTDNEPVTPAGRRCSNSSSSEDSEDSTGQDKRLTRSSHKRMEKEHKSDKGNKSSNGRRSSKKANRGGESAGSSSVRVTRKSTGSQSGPQLMVPTSPEPEIPNKRCSALNAAAKLLAMRGRGPDSPGSNSKGKAAQEQQGTSEKNSSTKGKSGQESPKTNSAHRTDQQTPARLTDARQATADTSRSAVRSTRQRPGYLVPPLEPETKRLKKEEKKNISNQKEVEDENRDARSWRGHSACSSISSERGPGSSRSRSSSNSSQRTHSLSSLSTGRLRSHSRAPSSGSDTDRGKVRSKKMEASRSRGSKRERRSQKHDRPELSTGSSEGTPDRVLRSVAALAAAQARTPASNTRSSTSQHRLSKT